MEDHHHFFGNLFFQNLCFKTLCDVRWWEILNHMYIVLQ